MSWLERLESDGGYYVQGSSRTIAHRQQASAPANDPNGGLFHLLALQKRLLARGGLSMCPISGRGRREKSSAGDEGGCESCLSQCCVLGDLGACRGGWPSWGTRAQRVMGVPISIPNDKKGRCAKESWAWKHFLARMIGWHDMTVARRPGRQVSLLLMCAKPAERNGTKRNPRCQHSLVVSAQNGRI